VTFRTLLIEAADALRASPSRTIRIEHLLERIDAALEEDREALDEITLTKERDSARHDHAKAIAERDEARAELAAMHNDSEAAELVEVIRERDEARAQAASLAKAERRNARLANERDDALCNLEARDLLVQRLRDQRAELIAVLRDAERCPTWWGAGAELQDRVRELLGKVDE
jgi:hypothetical protein